MLKIPEPVETKSLKLTLTASTKKELDAFVAFMKTKQAHATTDAVVEAMIAKTIPKVGPEAKAYREFKNTLHGHQITKR